MKRYIGVLVLSVLLTPAVFAASKEQQEMQRDIAQLQDQVRTLQSTVDQQMATIKTLLEQSVDAGNKNSSGLSVLSNNLTQAVKDALRPVANLTAKVDNANNDISDVRNAMADLNTQMNKLQQQLADINNAIKVLQAPPAAPPPAVGGSDVLPQGSGAAASGPPPSAKSIFDAASGDYSRSNSDLAANEFAEFVRLYPDDARASEAQFYIGMVHYGQMKYDQAVMDFDAVLERFQESSKTPDAYFMKGKALKAAGQRDAAVTVWRSLIKKYPHSDMADQAKDQITAMGLRVTPAASARKK